MVEEISYITILWEMPLINVLKVALLMKQCDERNLLIYLSNVLKGFAHKDLYLQDQGSDRNLKFILKGLIPLVLSLMILILTFEKSEFTLLNILKVHHKTLCVYFCHKEA